LAHGHLCALPHAMGASARLKGSLRRDE